jgi:hypothetical protein
MTIVDDGLLNQLKSKAAVSDFTKANHAVPAREQQIEKMECWALWDTGATGTVVSPRAVAILGLPTISEIGVWGVGGPALTTLHVIDLWLPNLVIIPRLQVTMGFLDNDIDVLIGMDVIGRGDFAVSNFEGRTAFSYRIPSIEFTDYCKGLT